jgi:hypothetical protein
MFTGSASNIIDSNNALTVQVVVGYVRDSSFGKLVMRSNATADNCIISNASTIGGTYNNQKIVNCRFSNNLTLTGDNISVINCNIGSVTSGSYTIIVNATSDKTILMGNRTEAAISNSGTNTEMQNNILF